MPIMGKPVSASTTENPSTVYDAQRVDEFVDTLQGALQGRVVTHEEVQAAAGSLKRLGPAERQAALKRISVAPTHARAPLLDRWMAEATAPGVGPWSGLKAAELDRWFDVLIEAQTSTQLERIFDSVRFEPLLGPAQEDDEMRARFIERVALQAAPPQRVALLARLARRAESGDDSAALAAARLLAAGRSVGETEAALGALSRRAMDAVVLAAAQQRREMGAGLLGQTISRRLVDFELVERMAHAVAQTSNSREKASFVAAAGNLFALLDGTRDDADVAQDRTRLLDGLRAVILSDGNGVVENTLLQEGASGDSSGPAALKAFNRAAIEAGRMQDVSEVLALLHRGNDLRGDALARYERTTARAGVTGHHHAEVLGQYIGTVVAAINAITARRDQAAAYGAFAVGGASDIGKENLGDWFKPSKVGIAVASAVFKSIVNAAILKGRIDAAAADKVAWQHFELTGVPLQSSGVRSRDTEAAAAFTAGLTRGRDLS
jgi:hypothetical protein